VVAADDGVMPQTIEAINHARTFNVPIIVAVNKIDKPGADPMKVRRELSEQGLIPEDWGGDTIFVDVSAKTGQGIEQLLEMIILMADILELKANPNKRAKGVIVETRLDKKKGPTATVIVQEGTLRVGDIFVAGVTHGRVRAMFDDKGRQVRSAGPSTPVEVLGFEELPVAGDTLVVVESERRARELAEKIRERREREEKHAQGVRLEDIYRKIEAGEAKELRLIVKTDTMGSLEALRKSLEELSTDEVAVRVIHGAVGGITENDVMLAKASSAIVVGFNTRPDPKARELMEKEKVDVRTYGIIYQVIDDVKKALQGLLEPVEREEILPEGLRVRYKAQRLQRCQGRGSDRVLRDKAGTAITLKLNRLCETIQGEGLLAGTPVILIRLQGCNLRCPWCDQPEALEGAEGEEVDLEELVRLLRSDRDKRNPLES